MPSFLKFLSPDPEKTSEGFLPNMGIVAILIIQPGLFINTLVSSSYMFSLALIGQAVSEKKIFENGGR